MLALTRKNKIMEILLEKKNATVAELSKKFSVTEETIRRDLKALESTGQLVRTYGGAFIQSGVMNEIRISLREDAYVQNKQRIAKQCGEFINNGDTIFLDSSSTALHICSVIANKRITVLTDSLKILNRLCEFENIHLLAAGGTYNLASASFVGNTTLNAISGYYVDKSFVSCRSLCMEQGITESNENIASVRKLIIERSNNVYIIADHTKFGNVSFVRICDFDSVDAVVTDEALSEEWHDFLKQKNVALYECTE